MSYELWECNERTFFSFLFHLFWSVQVRDRATLYLNTLGADGIVAETEKDVKEFLFGSLDVPLVNLEKSLRNYVCVIFSQKNCPEIITSALMLSLTFI